MKKRVYEDFEGDKLKVIPGNFFVKKYDHDPETAVTLVIEHINNEDEGLAVFLDYDQVLDLAGYLIRVLNKS